jgi:hypothetical protein
MIDIQQVASREPLNSYAPSWDIKFGLATWEEEAKVDKLRTYLLNKEQELLKQEPDPNDGGYELTARFGKYNLFDYANEESTLDDLLTWLRKSYIMFVEQDGTPVEDLYIICWFTTLNNGGKVGPHNHGASPITYISGNMHLDNYNTKTYYQYPYELHLEHQLQNKKGQVTFFPGYIFHRTDEYEGEEKRVSIAFDLWQTKYFGLAENGRVPSPLATKTFMNEEIANEIRSS